MDRFNTPPNFMWVSGSICWLASRCACIGPPEPTPNARIIAAFRTARKSFRRNDSRHLNDS